MAPTDEYITVAKTARTELKIERSLFIGSVTSVESEDAAKEFISKTQEEYKNATHNCYAYRVGINSNKIEYYSDAGEPSGTAGRPILNAIKRKNVTNLVLVVTRYFGGKKLGVRGLIEAYGATASQVIKEAGVTKRVIENNIFITCDYKDIDTIMYYISKYQGRVINSDYKEQVRLKAKVRQKNLPTLKAILEAQNIEFED